MKKLFEKEVIMQNPDEEITVCLPEQKDMDLAERLLHEIGGKIPGLRFCLMPGFPSEINQQFSSYAEVIRGMIRVGGLQREGFKWTNPAKETGDDDSAKFLNGVVIGRNDKNQKIFRGNIEDSSEKSQVEALLKKPINFHYQWHDVAYWNLGNFSKLQKQIGSGGSLMLKESGVLLFSDELQQLNEGKEIVVRETGGLNNWGFIENELDIYQVRNGCLYRVWAHLSD